jgi:hypothetical protein
MSIVSDMLSTCRELDLYYTIQNIDTDCTGIKQRVGIYGPGHPFMETWDGQIVKDKFDILEWYYNTHLNKNYKG